MTPANRLKSTQVFPPYSVWPHTSGPIFKFNCYLRALLVIVLLCSVVSINSVRDIVPTKYERICQNILTIEITHFVQHELSY